MTLTEFLLARIAEEEAVTLRRPRPSGWGMPEPSSPERILEECEIKRWIVELHSGEHECPGNRLLWVGIRNDRYVGEQYEEDHGCQTLGLLAFLYSSHPDFREEWRIRT